jgi:DNA-binding transcriptional MerR regulator
MLGIHRSTLSRWEEKGYLVPLEIGGRRLYKMSDIQRLLVSKK